MRKYQRKTGRTIRARPKARLDWTRRPNNTPEKSALLPDCLVKKFHNESRSNGTMRRLRLGLESQRVKARKSGDKT